MHDGRGLGSVPAAEGTEAEPEVQRDPHDHHEVGAPEGGGACAGDEQRVAGRQHASPHAVRDDRHAGGLCQPAGLLLRTVGPHVGPDHQHGPHGLGQQPPDLGDCSRVRGHRRADRVRGRPHLGPAEQLVHRDVEEDRAAVRCRGGGQRCVEAGGDLVHRRDRRRRLGHRREQRRVVELLKAPGPPAELGGAAAHHEQWRAVEVRGRHGADPVGHARACGEDREARPAGQLGRRLRSEHGGLLVADVDEPHRWVGLDGAVVHREDMCPGQGEHRVDAVGASHGDRVLAAVRVGCLSGCLPVRCHDRTLRDAGHRRSSRSPRDLGASECRGPHAAGVSAEKHSAPVMISTTVLRQAADALDQAVPWQSRK